MPIGEKILDILAEITENGHVRDNLDMQLFELGVLDSLKTVELMVALSEAFGVEISPAEFEREHWVTPRRIVAYMQSRVSG